MIDATPSPALRDLVDRTGFDPLDLFDAPPSPTDERRAVAIAHLRARFVEVVGPHVDGPWWDAVAARLLEDETGRARFVDEVLLEVPSPGHYLGMLSVIEWLLSADQLTDTVVACLDVDDARSVNALGLVDLVVGRPRGLRLGDANRRRLTAAVERRRAAGSNHDALSRVLSDFVVPHDPVEPQDHGRRR